MADDFRIIKHGRDSLSFPYQFAVDGVQSTGPSNSFYFECPDAGLRIALQVDDDDASKFWLYLTNAQVVRLPEFPSQYIIRDETDADAPVVRVVSTAQRYGYTEQPGA